MKKYLLFDLDGTLTDPKLGICTCVQYALSSFGIQEPDLDKLEPFIGPPLKESFMKFYNLTDSQADAAVEKYRERFSAKGLFENKLYRGIPAMLRALRAGGLTLAVASSKPTVYVRRILKHFRIEKYFKAVVGSELDGRRVNKDEVVREALNQLFGDSCVEPDQVYMIGDRCFDVEGAHSLGIESVGVTYGYGGMEELTEAKSDYIVRSVEELRYFLLREAEELPNQAGIRQSLRLWLAFGLFFAARYAGVCLAQMAFLMADRAGRGSFFLYSGEGVPERLTGDAAALSSAAGFFLGGAAVFFIAKRVLADTAEEMRLFHLRAEPKSSYALLFVAVLGAALGTNMLLELTGVTALSSSYQAVAENQYAASLWVGLICYGVVAPIAEELMFRGIVYGALRRMLKPALAMAASAALFGVYHGNLAQGIYAFVMGCLMVYAYEYFGYFWCAVGVHMTANLLIYSLAYLVPADAGLVSAPVCVGCLVCAAGAVYLLYRGKKN